MRSRLISCRRPTRVRRRGRLQISDRGHCQNLGRRQFGHAGDEDELLGPRARFVGDVGDQVVEIADRSDKPRQNLARILGSQREIQAVRTYLRRCRRSGAHHPISIVTLTAVNATVADANGRREFAPGITATRSLCTCSCLYSLTRNRLSFGRRPT